MTPSHPLPSEPDLAALADSWDAAAARADERAMMGDPAAALAQSSTLRSCAAALRAAQPRSDVGLRDAARAVVREYDTSDEAHIHGSVEALRAALAADKGSPVEAFLASIPDDGLPDRIGDHYRVVTVCGHCGEVWSKIANRPPAASDRERLLCQWCGDDLALDEIVGHLASEGREIPAAFTEAELQLYFRCYKAARRIATATAGGDKERAADELRALLELVEPYGVEVR